MYAVQSDTEIIHLTICAFTDLGTLRDIDHGGGGCGGRGGGGDGNLDAIEWREKARYQSEEEEEGEEEEEAGKKMGKRKRRGRIVVVLVALVDQEESYSVGDDGENGCGGSGDDGGVVSLSMCQMISQPMVAWCCMEKCGMKDPKGSRTQ